MTTPTPARDSRIRDELIALLEQVQKDHLGHRPYERAADAIIARWLVLDLDDPAAVEQVARALSRHFAMQRDLPADEYVDRYWPTCSELARDALADLRGAR